MSKSIAICGAGFTGLAAGLQLLKLGYKVTIFEKERWPGGLADGFKDPSWNWTLEKHYHHFFTNDNKVLDLAKEIGHKIIIERPNTSVFVDNEILQLDSPLKALTFPKLSLLQRLRMSLVLAIFRYNPFWKPLEKLKTTRTLPKLMGKKAYKMIWEPQLVGKFGKNADEISLAWFWARIKKRTTKLAYPEKGFLEFAKNLVQEIEKKGGKIHFETQVNEIESKNKIKLKIKSKNIRTKEFEFDKVIVTLPSFTFLKIARGLPSNYQKKLSLLKGLGAINVVIRLKKPFFPKDIYWLSVCDKNSPAMAVVEHTNFMDKSFYNNEHIIYVGKYLPFNHSYFQKSDEEILKTYDPYLRKMNENYKKEIIDYKVFRAPFAQPLIPINYSKIIPSFTTPLNNVYLANIQQVYPWDRGTNYAVEMGEKVAEMITERDK
ncbi:FAD-dependent oxidoreductase [Candidatus Parcubacteria bacterium]|nr:MAG: FAD-dependent oxidoreductase [Candidatus Parcubacteria bacterium]